jgi:hypothetical protein
VSGQGFEGDRMGLDGFIMPLLSCCWILLRPQHRQPNQQLMVDWRRRVKLTSSSRSSALPDFGNGTPHFLSLVASKISHLIWASKILFAFQLFHLFFSYSIKKRSILCLMTRYGNYLSRSQNMSVNQSKSCA